MNKQFILICLISGILFSASVKSQVNSEFTNSSDINSTNLWNPDAVCTTSWDNLGCLKIIRISSNYARAQYHPTGYTWNFDTNKAIVYKITYNTADHPSITNFRVKFDLRPTTTFNAEISNSYIKTVTTNTETTKYVIFDLASSALSTYTGTYNVANFGLVFYNSATNKPVFVDWIRTYSDYTTAKAYVDNHKDYFRTKATGNWSTVSIWESSADNISFADATDSPTYDPASVIVQNSHVISVNSNAVASALSINAGGAVTVNNGSALSLSCLNLLSNGSNGTATLADYNANGNLVIREKSTIQQYLGSARNWYVSSPVSNATSPATNITRYYEYVEAGNNADFSVTGSTAYWKGLNTGNTMEIGKGYIAQASAGTTVSFSGTPNNGNITTTFDLTRDDAKGKGFNLVGNPYPSYIDWSLVTTANPNLSKTFYFRSKNTNVTSTYTFVSYNGLLNTSVSSNGTANTTITRFIPPTQAFWVRVNSGTTATKMYFNNDMRAHRDDNGNLLKAPKLDNRTCLRLQLMNGSESDETLICTESNADNGFDMYDSPKMMNNSTVIPDLYTKADAERLVINGLNEISDNMELPLGFSLNATATLKLKATEMSNFPDGTRIYLLDKHENTQTELTPETEYSFSTTTATTNNESRFSLLFRVPGNTTGISNTETGITKVFVNTQNQITIIARPGSNYTIYNAVGQLIENGILNSKFIIHNSKLNAGVYVVKVNNQSTRVVVK